MLAPPAGVRFMFSPSRGGALDPNFAQHCRGMKRVQRLASSLVAGAFSLSRTTTIITLVLIRSLHLCGRLAPEGKRECGPNGLRFWVFGWIFKSLRQRHNTGSDEYDGLSRVEGAFRSRQHHRQSWPWSARRVCYDVLDAYSKCRSTNPRVF
jgi:hypothetical protein